MKRLISALLVFCTIALSLCSCVMNTATAKSVTDEMFALDTIITFTVYAQDNTVSQTAIDTLKAEISRCENLLSATVEGSDIYRINNSSGEQVAVSEETASIIRYAQTVSAKTNGAFDISVYPLMKLWGFDTKQYTVPNTKDIKATLQYVDFNNIELTDDNKVTVKNGMSLDLGGIAKGYISNRIYDLLSDSNVTSAVINVGGNVVLFGKNPQAQLWQIGIQSPSGSDCFATIYTEETTISTTGAYQRNFEVDSVVYHHIIDPATGKPSESDISSATVVGMNDCNADAWSTAYYVMGIEKTIDFYKSNSDAPEFVILDDKMSTVYCTKQIEELVIADDYTSKLEVVVISR